MNRLKPASESGQSLVLFAFLSIAIFAMLAFSLDMGYLYYMRRWAQNAADSAALAAAREICVSEQDREYDSPTDAALDFAETKNLAFGVASQELTDICFSNTVGCPILYPGEPILQPGEAKVQVQIDYPTFVSAFFGQPTSTVLADAAAGCFAPGAAEGVLPIAWNCRRLDPNDDSCIMEYVNQDDTCEVGEDYMYIFFGDDTEDELLWCNGWAPPVLPPGSTTVPKYINCDANGDGLVDIEPVTTANLEHSWSWVDLDGGNCDANELHDIIYKDLEFNVSTHTWLDECEGNKTAAYGDIVSAGHVGDDLVIPVFNPVCTGTYPGANCNPAIWHPEDTVVEPVPLNSGTDWYHILTFALFRVSCVDSQGNQCTDNNPSFYLSAREALFELNPDKKIISQDFRNSVSSIEGCFVEGFNPDIIGRPSDGVNAGTWTLYLTR